MPDGRSILAGNKGVDVLDIVIRNATVIDGTATAARRADIGIRDGLIVAVGDIDEPAHQTIDAEGLVAAPGFIDPHTHYDAQLFWDPHATPSNLHGVTTVIAGNCGFTLAPLGDDSDAEYLRKMMVKVEGMPLEALENGIDWSWRSFADYLDRLEGAVAVNVGFLVGHCALRRVVMKDDAVGHEATPDQVEAMRRLLAQSLEAGGMGFSTSQAYTHSDWDGQPVPSRWAGRDEILTLAREVADHPGTTLEWVTDGCMQGFTDDEIELMIDMSLAARRPLNWNVLTIDSARPDEYRHQIAAGERAAERGARVVALTMPILVGMNMSFGRYCALNMMPDWGDILGLPLPERIEKLKDPEVRRFMELRAASPDAGVFARLTGWGDYVIGDTFSPANEGLKGRRVADIARERGVRDFYCLLDIAIADELRTVLWPGPTDDDAESWRLRAEAWRHPHVMIGGSDAGAHLDRMAGAPYTTAWLADCIRGRRLMGLEEAIHHLTDVPARLFGLRGRGRVAEGYRADLVLFDPETVDATPVELRHDLPGGTARLWSEAVGIERVMVGGVTTVLEGRETGELPGRVLRSGRDTDTVTVPGAA
ncbi:MAG: D-aminoacylase [Actinomyces sp.]|nr:MAG: D-aminoacylase [Actinomyces sp.]